MIEFSRHTTREAAEKRRDWSCADPRMSSWWQVRHVPSSDHLAEYPWRVVFEPPDTAPVAPPVDDCPVCHGDGVVQFNPSPRRDPQCVDEARCDACHGTGRKENQ